MLDLDIGILRVTARKLIDPVGYRFMDGEENHEGRRRDGAIVAQAFIEIDRKLAVMTGEVCVLREQRINGGDVHS